MSSEELMYANWQHMIKPEKIQVSSNPSYGKLAAIHPMASSSVSRWKGAMG
jgi:hypothetical protein